LASHALTLRGLVPAVAPARGCVLSARREARLVRAAQQGDRAAVEALFMANWPQLHRAAWLITRDRAAAEDIAQEAFLAALAALDRFDRRRRIGPWLRTIVARRAIDHARARALRREVNPDALESETAEPSADPLPSDDILAALGDLEHDRRTVVVLRHLLDLTPTQIGDLLGIPVGTVNSRLRRALDELQNAIEREHG
jgi:RNA polymerase sigma-70 factor (ECF subfamily)